MTDDQIQPSRLRRLLARLRQAKPQQPRWRHFAPHAALVVLAAAASFFSDADRVAGEILHLDDFCFLFILFSILLFIPISTLHALLRWVWFCSWRGFVWLLRPTLLCAAVLVILYARGYGRVWSFERAASGYTAVMPLLLQQIKTLPCPSGEHVVQLPQEHRALTDDGTVTLVSTPQGFAIYFDRRRGPDVYIDGTPPKNLRDGHWHGKHWYLVTWSIL